VIGPGRAHGVIGWVAALAATPGLSPTPGAGPAAGRPVGLTLVIGIAIVGALLYMVRRRFERADEVFDPRPRPRVDPEGEDGGAGPPVRGGPV
jgi:hypothetical protein